MKYISRIIITCIFLCEFYLYSAPAGIVLYGDNQGLKYRIYDTETKMGSEQQVPGITTQINFIRAAACPTRPEIIVLALDNSGTLYCSTWTSTGGWAESPRIIRSGGDTTNRWFDVVYTKNGHAMIVYSDGTTALKYTIWNGLWWENVRDVGNLHDGKLPCWVTLAACPTREEVIMVYQNKDNRRAYASVWISSGPTRGFVSDFNIQVTAGGVSNSDAREGVTVTYESISGEGIIIFNASGINARVWNGSSWSAPITGGGSGPNNISAKPKPSGDEILVCYNIQSSGDTRFRIWNGNNNSWDTEQTMNPNRGSAGYYQIDGDWELTSGHESHYLVVSWIQSGGSYLHAGLLAKRWTGSNFIELYPVSGTSGITYNSVYLKTLTRIQGTASPTIQVLANTAGTLNAWDFDCYNHQFDYKQELETSLSRTTNPHQSFVMVAFYNYTPPDTTPPAAINDLQAQPGLNPGEIVLSWSATGDDGNSGTITGGQYRLRYSTYVTSDPNFWTSGSWTDPQNKYELLWSTNTTPFEPQKITLQNLTEGVIYYFRIWLKDDSNNWSQISNQASSYPKATPDTTPPAKVQNITLNPGPGGCEITVVWQATGDDGSSNNITAGKYRIRYATHTQVDWFSSSGWDSPSTKYQIETTTNIIAGTYQTNILSNLLEGVTYYIRIWLRDENEENWSEPSDIFSGYSKSEPPASITDLKAEGYFFGIKEGEIKLSWTAVGDNAYSGVAKEYIIRVSTISNINNDTEFENAKPLFEFSSVSIPQPASPGTIQTLIVSGLIPGVTYYFAIKVKDNVGLLSGWSRDFIVNTNNYAMAFDEIPPKVSNLTITELDKQLNLQWSYNFSNVKDFSHFVIHCDSTSSTLWDDSFIITQTTNTFCILTGLENNILYTFKILAVDLGPNVLESEPEFISGTPKISKPLKPQNFVGVAISTTSILWSWKYTSTNVNMFSIYDAKGNLLYQMPLEPPVGPEGEFLEENLTPNTSSQVSYIIVSNQMGNSDPCYAQTKVFTFSNPPSEITLVSVSSVNYRLSFSSNNNPLYTRYAVYISTDDVNYNKIKDIEDNFTINRLPLSLILQQDSAYFFKFWSYNQDGIPSKEVKFSTRTYDEIPPAKIIDLTVILSQVPGKVDLRWTSPGDNGNSKTFYGQFEIRWTDNPLYTWDLIPQSNHIVISTTASPGEIQSISISGLPYNTTVYFMIRSIDDYGNPSEISSKVSIYIPKPTKVPYFVAGLKLKQKTQNSLTLSWSKVTRNQDGTISDDVCFYHIYKSTLSLDNLTFLAKTSSDVLEFTDFSYDPGRVSYYAVKAVNSLNVESIIKMYLNSNGDVIFISDDKEVKVDIPYKASSFLYRQTNNFSEDLIVNINKLNIGGYISSYDISFYGYETSLKYYQKFEKGEFSISFSVKNYSLDEIQVYYWLNDKDTIRISDVELIRPYNMIKINTIYSGLFSLKREKLLSTEIKIESIRPKIITPTSQDTNYSKSTIYINNMQKQQVLYTKIYDLKGNLITDKLIEEKKDFIYSWDGKTNNGEIVPAGPYIYEIKVGNKILRGIIIVAR
ncbi:MAG: fibronectin type III domain-containing protein [Endomicrobiia bacterium]